LRRISLTVSADSSGGAHLLLIASSKTKDRLIVFRLFQARRMSVVEKTTWDTAQAFVRCGWMQLLVVDANKTASRLHTNGLSRR
jgi:hypothetical protein